MYTYLIMFSVLSFIGLIFSISGQMTKRKSLAIVLIFFLIELVIMGTRTPSVGTDTQAYCNQLFYFKQMSFNEAVFNDSALLYNFLLKLLSFFTTDEQIYIFIVSFAILFLAMIFIFLNSKSVIFSSLLFILFYHFFNSFNLSRQYLAVLIVANAFPFIKKNKVFPTLILMTIAVFIHNTAIFSFILFPLVLIKKRSSYIFYLAIIFACLFAWRPLLNLFVEIFPHYKMYLDSMLTEQGQNRKIVITFVYVVIFIFSLFGIKNKKMNSEYQKLFICNLFGIICGIIALQSILISRIEVYFTIFAIIFIPLVFDHFKLKDRVILKFSTFCLMCIPMIFQLYSGMGGVKEYVSILLG